MKLLVRFSHGSKPIIAQAVKDTGVLINVERASSSREGEEALVEVADDCCKIVSSKMRDLGAVVRILEEYVQHDEEECVDCGACISLCPKGVFSFDKDWKLVVEGNLCILCERCVSACPQQALSIRSSPDRI